MASRVLLLAAATFLVGATSGALGGTPFLVVDAASGKVLSADRATDPWYPASVTKLMTTYVALDLVRQGKFSMNSLLTLSAEAAAEPPSKMGFKPGTQLTLENALKIIMVKSANDVAMMISENLGGSVEGFSALMNDASRRLGMRESRWYNGNGLPDDRQQTSARDMAILARALINEFPEHEDLFRIGALKLGRKIMRNHNGMLGRYPGVDGMKTGFICSGGFNIVASSTQNGRRLIAVVFGHASASERDLRAANLFDQGFATVGWGSQTLDQLPPSAAMSPPNMRPYVCGPHKRQPQEDDETAVVAMRGGAGNSDNPIASLFSPATFAAASAGAAAGSLGTRTTLGPRVAFEPIPIWLGASPGAGQAADIAAKPVRTKVVGRNAPKGGVAGTTLSATVPPSSPEEGERVKTLAAKPKPALGKAALIGTLDPKPTADAKPKLGAIGPAAKGRPKLGAIESRPTLPVAVLDSTSLKKRDAEKPTPKAKQAAVRKPAPKKTDDE